MRTNPAHGLRSFWPCVFELCRGMNSILEVGCGEGHNLRALPVDKRVGIEVHRSYVVEGGGVEFIIGDALKVLPTIPDKSFDFVMLIDVIEHFYREDALKVLPQIERIARKQVLLWTPEGLMIQDEQWHDTYNNREWTDWLEHKSSWTAYELAQRGYDGAVWPLYHKNYLTGQQTIPALFAVKFL